MKNNNKMDEFYNNFKETWSNPRKKAAIKLGGYFIFFFVLLLFAAIANNMDSGIEYVQSNTTNTTTTEVIDKYITKQNDLLTSKYNINYVIKVNNIEYKINGSMENKILTGYLEKTDEIKKIVFKDNILYEIKNNEEVLLETEINKDYININYIINLIKQSSAIIETVENGKNYSYDLSEINTSIIVKTNDVAIDEINIVNGEDQYCLNFDK